MTKKHLFFLLLLFSALILGGVVFLLSDRGLNGFVRPRLETFLGGRLGAEVRVDRIAVQRGQFQALGVTLQADERYRIDVPRLVADFTLKGLLERRLESLRLSEPVVRLSGGGGGQELPDSPPLRIGQLEIEGGTVLFSAGGQPRRLDSIDLSGALADPAPFHLSARFGVEAGIALEARGRLAWGRGGAVILEEVRWEGKDLLAEPLAVSLSPEGGSAGGSLRLERFGSDTLERVAAAFGQSSPLPQGVGFDARSMEVTFQQAEETLHLGVRAEGGTVTSGERRYSFRDLRGEADRRGEEWEGAGTFRLAGTAPVRISWAYAQGEAKGHIELTAENVSGLLSDVAGGAWPEVKGGMHLAGDLSAGEGHFGFKGNLTGIAGSGDGDLPDISGLDADVVLRKEGDAAHGKLNVRNKGRALLEAEGTPEKIRVSLAPVGGRELLSWFPESYRSSVAAGAEGLSGVATLVRQEHGWTGEGSIRASRIPLSGNVLEGVEVKGRLDVRDDGVTVSRAEVAARFSGEGVPSGELKVLGSGEWRQKGFNIRLERLVADKIQFISPDGMTGISGGYLRGRGTVAGRPGKPLRLDVTADLGAGEALKGSLYADLSEVPATFALQGAFDADRRRLEAQRLFLSVPRVGTIDLRGTIAGESAELKGVLDVPDLPAAFHRLRPALGESLAPLSEIEPAGGGKVEGVLGRDASGWHLSGSATLRELGVVWPQKKIDIAGVTGKIPLQMGEAPVVAGPSELSLSRLALGPAVLEGKRIVVRTGAEGVTLARPLVFRVAGGELEIAEPAVTVGEDKPEFTGIVKVRGVELGELTRALALTEMAGRLSADFGRIRFREGALSTEGEMKIEVFGGQFRVRNLRMESLFTPYPTYSADAEFTGIDLQQLTRTLAFGEINGIADGYIHELRLFGKVPSRFEARFETRPQGRRNISVKALRNLTTISQGGLGAVLSRGVYRFIDFYRYRKIGLYCSLENDVFTLRGTARDGSDRFLVEGGLLPPKINILAPQHTISFKEMVKRLQRMDRSAEPTTVN